LKYATDPMRARLPHDITDLSRTVGAIAETRPDVPVNALLFGAFESLYGEALRAGAPEYPEAAGWSDQRRPTYGELAPVLADLAKQPAIAPHRPSGRPGGGARRAQ
jgi:hypothetical protein